VAQANLNWESKAVLLAVMPFVAVNVVLQAYQWAAQAPSVAIWSLGLSGLLGLLTVTLRAATPGAAVTGAVITANLMFSTAALPYAPWHTALIPVLAVFLLAFGSTRAGRRKKQRLGTAEHRRGRSAPQVAANLGMAALVCGGLTSSWTAKHGWLHHAATASLPLFTIALAALAEAAADTVSSEMGQVLGGRPRMITTLRVVEPGRDGAISPAGTVAGILAAGLVAAAGTQAVGGSLKMFWISWAGGVFGLFFDSLLGATLEERGLLNNDAVNFLSTAGAAAVALVWLKFC
jgi:uncharacterized protein (TIGR00297 family)